MAKARKIHRTADQSRGSPVEVSVRCCDSAISTRSKSSGGLRSSSARATFSSMSAWVAASMPPAAMASCCACGRGLLGGHRLRLVVGGHAVLVQEGEADDADEHERRAEHREDEELERRVDPLAVAPPADEEVHRHEHDLEHHEEEEEVEASRTRRCSRPAARAARRSRASGRGAVSRPRWRAGTAGRRARRGTARCRRCRGATRSRTRRSRCA